MESMYFTDPFQERGSAFTAGILFFLPLIWMRDLEIELCKYFSASDIILWSLLKTALKIVKSIYCMYVHTVW